MKAIATAAMAAMLVGAAPGPARVGDLGWLAGSWERSGPEEWAEEFWSPPRGGTMFGFGRTGRGESLREYEHLRLQAGDDGVPVYWGSPFGRPAVPFRLVESGPGLAVFANPAHDFPQRIVYRREGRTLKATISASDGGNAISWTFRRR